MLDVLIIGAGPAGNRAASLLANLGWSVLVLDQRERIGDKLCSGIVSKECVDRYSVPPNLLYRDVKSSWIFPPQWEGLFVQRSEVQACVIDRVGFVRELATRAQIQGARYLLERRVVNLRRSSSGVSAAVRYRGTLEEYEAKVVIVATGFASSVGSDIGLEQPRKVAFAAQVTLMDVGADELQVYAGRWVPQGFFGWLIPTTAGNALAGVLGRGRPVKPLQDLIKGIKADGIRIGSIGRRRAWGVPLRPSTKSISDRCILIGDSAGQVKPTSGGGILYAMRCAEIGAEVVSQCLKNDDMSKKALLSYEKQWKNELGKELRLGYLARLAYERMTPRELDLIFRTASSSGILDGDISFDRHSELLARAVKSRFFGTILDSIPMIGTHEAREN